jgi:hypothetical protein
VWKVGRSLPRLVLATIAPVATWHQVSVLSDGDDETSRMLLTGGLPAWERVRLRYSARPTGTPKLNQQLTASPRFLAGENVH